VIPFALLLAAINNRPKDFSSYINDTYGFEFSRGLYREINNRWISASPDSADAGFGSSDEVSKSVKSIGAAVLGIIAILIALVAVVSKANFPSTIGRPASIESRSGEEITQTPVNTPSLINQIPPQKSDSATDEVRLDPPTRIYTIPDLKNLLGTHPANASLRGDFLVITSGSNRMVLQAVTLLGNTAFRGRTLVIVTSNDDLSRYQKDSSVTFLANEPLLIQSVYRDTKGQIVVEAKF